MSDECFDIDSLFHEWQREAMFPTEARYAFAAGYVLAKRMIRDQMERDNHPMLKGLKEALNTLKGLSF